MAQSESTYLKMIRSAKQGKTSDFGKSCFFVVVQFTRAQMWQSNFCFKMRCTSSPRRMITELPRLILFSDCVRWVFVEMLYRLSVWVCVRVCCAGITPLSLVSFAMQCQTKNTTAFFVPMSETGKIVKMTTNVQWNRKRYI